MTCRKSICGSSPISETLQRHQSFKHSQRSTIAFLWLAMYTFGTHGCEPNTRNQILFRKAWIIYICPHIHNCQHQNTHITGPAVMVEGKTTTPTFCECIKKKKRKIIYIFWISVCKGYKITLKQTWNHELKNNTEFKKQEKSWWELELCQDDYREESSFFKL